MIYADYAATTPVAQEVFTAMEPYFTTQFFNPSSIYSEGRACLQAVENVRTHLATTMGALPEEIIFTGSGTESANLAIKGVAFGKGNVKKHIITTAIEHHAVLETCRQLETMGFSVTYLPVDAQGMVQPDTLEKAITSDTSLVSIMWVNNETGALQDIQKLAAIAHQKGALFHTDAVQAMATQAVNVQTLGVDLLSFSAHKFYGPKGCGGLYCRQGIALAPLISGGQQERNLRAGTENVPAIIGMGKALELLEKNRAEARLHMAKLKDKVIGRFGGRPDTCINSLPLYSVPSICNVGFANIEAEAIVFHMSRAGILLSMGAACNSQSIEPSHVIQALHVPPAFERGCIRISFSQAMTEGEADMLCERLHQTVSMLSDGNS